MKSSKKEPVIYDYMPFTAEDVAAALKQPEVKAVCWHAELRWVQGHPMYFPDMWELVVSPHGGESRTVLWLREKDIRILYGFGGCHNVDVAATADGLKQALSMVKGHHKEMPTDRNRTAAAVLLTHVLQVAASRTEAATAKKVA